MSIQIFFTMKPKKKLFQKTVLDLSSVVDVLKRLEKEEEIRIELKKKNIKITYCPEGYLWFIYKEKNNQISGDCQSSVAGPGFHAAVIELLEKVSKELGLKLLVEDDTGYFKHRNFEKMKREHFYPWIKSIMTLLCEQYSKTDYKICWNVDSYSPKVIPGTVITPIRRFTLDEIDAFSKEDPELFAKEFFIWNEKRRDARFYRNSGLAEMSMKCYFMFSERSIWDGVENVICIQYLERALQYDCRIPFPKTEYRLLCRLNEQQPVSLEGVLEFVHACEIGYRRQEIMQQMGSFTYSVYGNCLEKYDREKNTILYYDDAPGHWHNIRVASLHFSDRKANFSKEMFEKWNVTEVLEFPVLDGNCKLAVYQPVPLEKSPEGFYYEMSAQMILDNQLLLVTQTYCRAEEKTEILNWFRRIEGKRRRQVSLNV